MIDDETRAMRSVPVPRPPLDDVDDVPLGCPAPPLATPGDPRRTRTAARGAEVRDRSWDPDATRLGGPAEWPATRLGGPADPDATRVDRVAEWDATVVGGPADPDATALAGVPALEATTAISARRRADLAAESPVDATAAIASVRPVFVDERGRRTRSIKFGVYSVVAVCVVFLAVVGVSLAAGNSGPLMEIPLLGGASTAEASDTVETDEIAPPPAAVAEAPATTTRAPAATATRAPAAPVATAPAATTTPPAPTTTVAPAPTTTAAQTTTRTRPTRGPQAETTSPDTVGGSDPDNTADTEALNGPGSNAAPTG
ncbi:hypothetical protein ACL02T_28770 [Pseudonocardia sp. RS010]|uniref:hypothetical protein n=1 Tax=Pseudonocardia sp. RS010 TaxID=3385979 RepID=UPI0039A32F22